MLPMNWLGTSERSPDPSYRNIEPPVRLTRSKALRCGLPGRAHSEDLPESQH